MATKQLTRRSPVSIARTARRGTNLPRFTRIKSDLTLEAPNGFEASAILKLIGHDGKRRIYALWLLVGRNGEDRVAVPYKYTGEDTIRCDIPAGRIALIASLKPYLRKFLKDEGSLEGDPPKIGH